MSVLSISQNNVDVSQATDKQLVFNDKYPFHKLDKSKTVSFQNIRLFFNTEPPNPTGVYPTDVGPVTTLVYSFPHGYKYTPATWFLMSNVTSSGTGLQPAYQQEGGYGGFFGALILETNELDFTAAILRVTADSTNVNFYVDKYWSNPGGANPTPANIAAFTLLIRVYVFAEDLLGLG
jgi:hypothetical protein